MNTVCASAYLYLLQFLSSVSYNFLSTGLTSLARFIHRYFILFEAIVNGIVFLISLSVSSLLVYKNATDFWVLILYPTTLLNSFISSSSFWWNLWGSLCTVSCHLQLMTVLLLPFQYGCILFPLLVWLLCLPRTSNTTLNKRGESGHPCLGSSLKGNTCVCWLSMILTVSLSYVAFIMLRYVPSTPTLLRGFFFIINGCWTLSNNFS